MWSPKNLNQALIPIVVLNWLSGLGLVQYPVGNSRRNWNLIFVMLIVSSFWFANVIFEFNSCANADAHSLDVMVFTMLRYFNSLTASLSLIIGWYSRQVSLSLSYLIVQLKFNILYCHILQRRIFKFCLIFSSKCNSAWKEWN